MPNPSPNKVALITGASRGIGAATARLFAENGYDVCINYLRDSRAAEEVCRQVKGFGVRGIPIQADVSDAKSVTALFDPVHKQLGPLSVLVNNAGILEKQCSFLDISEARFQRVLQTKLIGSFQCGQHAVRVMSNQYGGADGAIVNLSSGAAKSGSQNEYVDYAASKGALDSMTRGLALEVAGQGIRVNGVRPGFIYTDMHASGGEPNRVDRLRVKIPMQRGGTAQEVAEAIYWLASEKSAFVTGTFVDVLGGS